MPGAWDEQLHAMDYLAYVYLVVGREGGDAGRLTAGAGVEIDPAFSPDGAVVTFTGDYDGNTGVYVVPAAGGVPRRLTYPRTLTRSWAGRLTASASFSARPGIARTPSHAFS